MPRKAKYYTTQQVTVPVSLHQETRLLKKFVDIPEVREELGSLIAKSIATLDWCMENGTPGVKLGAAQTVLQAFVPRAPQVVESLNYDVADLSPEQQNQVLRLAKDYRSIVGSAPERRGAAAETNDRRAEAQALLLDAPDGYPPYPDFGTSWVDTPPGPSESGEGTDLGRGQQEWEEYVGDDRGSSVEPGPTPLEADPAAADVHPDRNPGSTVSTETTSYSGHAPGMVSPDVVEGEELDDGVGG